MNLRIGKFGRQESVSTVVLAAFASGCFAFDPRLRFSNGNASYITYAAASILSLCLFEATVTAIRRRGGCDLSCLIGTSKAKALLSIPLALLLIYGAIRPQLRFSETVTEYIFIETDAVNVYLYMLPCILLLTVLGAETLVRASRIFLPLFAISLAAALLLAVPQFRGYRLYPIPFGAPLSLLSELLRTLPKAFLPLIALLAVGKGTQNIVSLRTSGRIGALIGAALTLAALLGLSLSFSYGQLKDMSSPFYRLLVEVRTENPTMRLDRATFFLWMSVSLLASSFELFSACVLLAKTFHVRDVRPLACLMSALAVTLVLLLQEETSLIHTIQAVSDRYTWLLLLPLPLLWIRTGGEGRTCACGSCV